MCVYIYRIHIILYIYTYCTTLPFRFVCVAAESSLSWPHVVVVKVLDHLVNQPGRVGECHYGDIVEVCCRRLLKYVEASRLYHASMVFSITVELCVAIGSLVHFFSERWNSMTVLLAEVWKGLQEVKLWPLANGKACFHDWTFKNTLDMHMANQYFWASCHSK